MNDGFLASEDKLFGPFAVMKEADTPDGTIQDRIEVSVHRDGDDCYLAWFSKEDSGRGELFDREQDGSGTLLVFDEPGTVLENQLEAVRLPSAMSETIREHLIFAQEYPEWTRENSS